MARRTDGEKIDELEKLAAGMLERIIILERSVEQLVENRPAAERALVEARLAAEREIALSEQTCENLRQWQEKAAGRAWAVVPNVVGAVVNGTLAAAVAYFVARR